MVACGFQSGAGTVAIYHSVPEISCLAFRIYFVIATYVILLHLLVDKNFVGCVYGYLSLDYLNQLIAELVTPQVLTEVPDVCNKLL
jgi:hypothetical protein